MPAELRPSDLLIRYTNHRGEYGRRTVRPVRFYFGKCPPWHLTPQWLLEAIDLEKNETRTFALNAIASMESAWS